MSSNTAPSSPAAEAATITAVDRALRRDQLGRLSLRALHHHVRLWGYDIPGFRRLPKYDLIGAILEIDVSMGWLHRRIGR